MEPLPQTIADIRAGIRAGRYPNEAAVSQSIVRRVLECLGWPIYDPQIVWPEYKRAAAV
jgi:predicted type IV restriction endonuclease